MKNIHLLPTDKPSRFSLNSSGKYHLTNQLHTNSTNFTNRNIYITNDEEIKEGDWMYCKHFGEDIVCKYDTMNGQNTNVNEHKPFYQKIILTTDQDLINDGGVQAIDDEFLQWFVNNPSCEEVKIESWQTKGEWDLDYKPIIPQEEHPNQIKCYCGHTTTCDCIPLDEAKQETLEEAKLRQLFKNRSNCYADADDVVQTMDEDCFILTINEWQQERRYSEEEFLCFSEWVSSEDWVYLPSKGYWVNEEQEELEQKFTTKQLFEQFKKK
jgi:hypothetical protein